MFILFDIGGTNTCVAISKYGDSIDSIKHFNTPASYVDAMSMLQGAVKKLTNGEKPEMAAGGIAGILDADKTKLIHSPHLRGWEKENIQKDISRLIGAPVYLENDSNLAALGEATYGAGRDFNIVAYMSVSTGIGGGLVIGKEIVEHNGSCEPGYQIIDIRSLRTLEDYVSGAALFMRYDLSPDNIKDESVWKDMAHILAVGVANTIRHWGPDIMILGGGVMNQIPIVETERTTRELLHTKYGPSIVKTSTKDSVLYGALYIVQTKTHKIEPDI